MTDRFVVIPAEALELLVDVAAESSSMNLAVPLAMAILKGEKLPDDELETLRSEVLNFRGWLREREDGSVDVDGVFSADEIKTIGYLLSRSQ